MEKAHPDIIFSILLQVI
ncbi:MAG: hypothetical protein M5T52_22500 [Ignavibacteriaceae bacterium]|nr:hypothetical protein [Ignavibacteriaceae bacterium]